MAEQEIRININWDALEKISYKTNLGKSLKNTLRKFEKEDLVDELEQMIAFFHRSNYGKSSI